MRCRHGGDGYNSDPYFSKIIATKRTEIDDRRPSEPQYHYAESGLLFFEDWKGNNRICVPESMQKQVISEVHDGIMEAGHAGFHKTYNRIAVTHYWPRMSRRIKEYVDSCDICQKSKPKRHAPPGLTSTHTYTITAI